MYRGLATTQTWQRGFVDKSEAILILPIIVIVDFTPMKLNYMPILIGTILLAGCQSLSQNSGSNALSYRDSATGVQIERGRPNKVIDGVGWVFGAPTKLALWDRRADNHDVSKKTERDVAQYLSRRGLEGSLIRVNQYDPIGEWGRLTANKRISPGWRYTVGTYNQVKYIFAPGRIFGGDWYNPYTDTTHVYSDIAPLAISRAAYAKDIREQSHPGTYAATQEIPFVSLISTTRATNEALKYSQQYGNSAERSEAKRILSPDYGSSWGGQIASLVPFGAPIGRLAGAAVGHATNQIRGENTKKNLHEIAGEHSDDANCDNGGCDNIHCNDGACDGACDGASCDATDIQWSEASLQN